MAGTKSIFKSCSHVLFWPRDNFPFKIRCSTFSLYQVIKVGRQQLRKKKTKFNDFNGLMEVSYNLLNVIHVCVLKMRKHPKSLALFLPSISRKYLRKICQIICTSGDYNTAKVQSWRSKIICPLYIAPFTPQFTLLYVRYRTDSR